MTPGHVLMRMKIWTACEDEFWLQVTENQTSNGAKKFLLPKKECKKVNSYWWWFHCSETPSMTQDLHLFASPSSVYGFSSACLSWWQRPCCLSRYHIHVHSHSIILQRKKKISQKPLTTIITRWLPSLSGQNRVTGPRQAARKVFHPLWWKVRRHKPSVTSVNHSINCGRIRMFGLFEYWKSAVLFSLFVILTEWNENAVLCSWSLI